MKKVLMSILIALGPTQSQGGSNTVCDNALHACIELSKAQDIQVSNLKANVKKLESALVQAEKAPVLPTWAVIAISLSIGMTAGALLKH